MLEKVTDAAAEPRVCSRDWCVCRWHLYPFIPYRAKDEYCCNVVAESPVIVIDVTAEYSSINQN
jgi:hypothetical protein